MDELRSIRTFLAVAQQRSFAGAARRLGATPAAVTRAVAALEDRLGLQLLVRTTRQVSLTAAGAAYAARVEPLVEALASLTADLHAGAQAESGHLRLNAPMSLGMKILPGVLSAFQARFPRISFSVVLTDEFVDILQADCDLAIRISEPPKDKSTIWRKICHVERILVTLPGSAAVAALRPDQLDPAHCVAFSASGQDEIWSLTRAEQTCSLRAGRRFSANSGELLAAFVAQGGGVALLPRFIVAAALARGELVQVLPDWRPPDIWLTLYYPPYEVLPPRVAGFSDFFEASVIREGLLFTPAAG